METPAVKTEKDRLGIWEALLDNRIDVIATDHAPHTIEEKSGKYWTAPSGGATCTAFYFSHDGFCEAG